MLVFITNKWIYTFTFFDYSVSNSIESAPENAENTVMPKLNTLRNLVPL